MRLIAVAILALVATVNAVTITNTGPNCYSVDGSQCNNPGFTVYRGQTTPITYSGSGVGPHPLVVRVSNGGATYSGWNPAGSGAAINTATTVDLVIPAGETATQLFYQCTAHAGMIGTITIADASTGTATGSGPTPPSTGSGPTPPSTQTGGPTPPSTQTGGPAPSTSVMTSTGGMMTSTGGMTGMTGMTGTGNGAAPATGAGLIVTAVVALATAVLLM